MSDQKVYNSFQVKIDPAMYAERVKGTAEELFKKTACKTVDGSLLWDEVDISGGVLSAEVFCAAGEGDLDKSRELFEELCKTIAKEYSMANYMAKHSFAYANTDTTDYLLCFRKDSKLNFYQAEIADDVGCMKAKRYSLKYAFMKFEQTDEETYDDLFFGDEDASDNDFMQVLNGYELSKYPKASKKKPQKKTPVKPRLQEGKYYHVQYDYYGTKKELTGLLYNYFSQNCLFEMLDGTTESVEESDIKSIKEVFETEETGRIRAEYEMISKEIESAENKMALLRNEFYSRFISEGKAWDRRPLKHTDDGKPYPGAKEIEIGGTYLLNVKKRTGEVITDAVLPVSRYEDGFGGGFWVMGCVPEALPANIVTIPAKDEFTDALTLDEKGTEIQQRRMTLYQMVNELFGKRKELKGAYMRSFAG